MDLILKVSKARLILDRGATDKLYLTIDAETSFPEMKYLPCLTMETRQGYGLEYCRRVFKIEPEVISTGI